MLNKISSKLSAEIIKRESCIHYKQEVYTYGIEIILSSLVEIIAILISAIIFSAFAEGIIFIIVFSTLRIFVGGYHAKTYKKCFWATLGTFWLTLLGAHMTSEIFCEKVFWLLLCLSCVYIIAQAPVLNKAQPLNESEILKNVKMASVICICHIFINLEFLQCHKELLSMEVCTICSVAVLMLITDIIGVEGGENEHGIHCKDC